MYLPNVLEMATRSAPVRYDSHCAIQAHENKIKKWHFVGEGRDNAKYVLIPMQDTEDESSQLTKAEPTFA